MAFFTAPVSPSRTAFTLVELAIVLVIIGLLVGAVLAGKSLIRGAQLQNITSEHQRIMTAVQAFEDKYSALPGDMPNAQAYWGSSVNNGDGNGSIGVYRGQPNEVFGFWQHLASAGLIEGSYTGLGQGVVETPCMGWVAGGPSQGVPGVNVFKSRVPNGGWMAVASDVDLDPYCSYGQTPWVGNGLIFGAATDIYTDGPILTATEAWNIDLKMDDGNPATGKVVTNSCQNGNTPAGYTVSDSSVACHLDFVF